MLETIKLINKGISNMNQIVGLLKTIICISDNNEKFKCILWGHLKEQNVFS